MGERLNRHYVRTKFRPNLRGQIFLCADLTWDDPKANTRFTVVETDCTNFYKPSTRVAVVKTDYPNFYKSPTRIAEANTESPKFSKSRTRFRRSNGPLGTSTSLLHTLR